MATAVVKRYEELELAGALSRPYDYPTACHELALILRSAYAKLPKGLQSLLLRDTLSAFRLLPDVQTACGISSANLLLQAAQAALPKQKKALVVSEFKHAMVAYKRRCKSHLDGGLMHLPGDVLVHIFSFLDVQSLANVSSVCWAWNSAANDDMLWQLQYSYLFGEDVTLCKSEEQSHKLVKNKGKVFQQCITVDPPSNVGWKAAFPLSLRRAWNSAANDNMLWQLQYSYLFGEDVTLCKSEEQSHKLVKNKGKVFQQCITVDPPSNVGWKEAFKREYIGNSSWRFTSNRALCKHCKSMIWLSYRACARSHKCPKFKNGQLEIRPVSHSKVVRYLLHEAAWDMTSSESDDSDSDGSSWLPKLWAYPSFTSTGDHSS